MKEGMALRWTEILLANADNRSVLGWVGPDVALTGCAGLVRGSVSSVADEGVDGEEC